MRASMNIIKLRWAENKILPDENNCHQYNKSAQPKRLCGCDSWFIALTVSWLSWAQILHLVQSRRNEDSIPVEEIYIIWLYVEVVSSHLVTRVDTASALFNKQSPFQALNVPSKSIFVYFIVQSKYLKIIRIKLQGT